MRYSGIFADTRSPQACAFTIVIGLGVFLVLDNSAYKIASVKQRHPQQKEGLHPDDRILEALGKFDGFSCKVHGQPHLATDDMPSEVAPPNGKELRRLPYSFAKFARTSEDRTDFGSCVSAHGYVGGAEWIQELQF